MTTRDQAKDPAGDVFRSAKWYDQTINWSARFSRELPVLTEIFGPPAEGGLIDAGSGTGRHALALAARGYGVTGLDASEEMTRVAQEKAESAEEKDGVKKMPRFVVAPYHDAYQAAGGGFDGVYCLGNALAAAGTLDGVRVALAQFGECLRTGGKLFLQLLNFQPMRMQDPCVRGPRIANVDGQEYVSSRVFSFLDDCVRVTNVTHWHDGEWRQRSHGGQLYPIALDELRQACSDARLRIDETWGSYAREPFDVAASTDLIVVATRS